MIRGKGRIGDKIADGVIDKVVELDGKLLQLSNGSSRYVQAGAANTTLAEHIQYYLRQNTPHNDAKLPKRLKNVFESATSDSQRNRRAYYYGVNDDGLKIVIDAFYNAVLAESNTGKSSSPFTFATGIDIRDRDDAQTLDFYLEKLTGAKAEDNGHDALISCEKVAGAITESSLEWSDILKWERLLLREQHDPLRRIGDTGTYIEKKHGFLNKALRKEYWDKINWLETGKQLLFTIGLASANAVGGNAIGVATSIVEGAREIAKKLPSAEGIKKLKKIYASHSKQKQ